MSGDTTTVAPQQNGPAATNATQANVTLPTTIPAVYTTTATSPPTLPTMPVFTADDIARARAEEKDKLYGELSKVKESLKETKTELQKRLDAEKAAAAAEEEAKRRAAEEEMSLRELIEARDREYKAELARIQDERERERAAMEKERQFASLQSYIHKRVSELRAGDTVAPELLDLITGNSEGEVEQCIQMLEAKTSAILDGIEQARASQLPPRGVSTNGYAATGPLDIETGTKSFTREEIRDMPMSEWAQLRDKVLPGAARQRNQGLFG